MSVCPGCRMVVPSPTVPEPTRPVSKSRKTAAVPGPELVPVEEWQPVQVRVDGIPVTQGSMKAVGRGMLVHTKDKELKAWRALISEALTAAGAQPVGLHQPVHLEAVFYLPRPASVSVKKRPKPSAKSADLDKLVRAVNDALTGVVIEDDAQVTSTNARKRYADDGEEPGVWLRVTLDADG